MSETSSKTATYQYRVHCLSGECQRDNPLYVQGGYRADQEQEARNAGHDAVFGHGGRHSLRHELMGHWETEGE